MEKALIAALTCANRVPEPDTAVSPRGAVTWAS